MELTFTPKCAIFPEHQTQVEMCLEHLFHWGIVERGSHPDDTLEAKSNVEAWQEHFKVAIDARNEHVAMCGVCSPQQDMDGPTASPAAAIH
jgi:hypothetical protein